MSLDFEGIPASQCRSLIPDFGADILRTPRNLTRCRCAGTARGQQLDQMVEGAQDLNRKCSLHATRALRQKQSCSTHVPAHILVHVLGPCGCDMSQFQKPFTQLRVTHSSFIQCLATSAACLDALHRKLPCTPRLDVCMPMNRSDSGQILGADRLTTESKESTGGEHGQEQHLGVRQLSTDSADTPRSADAALERRLATGRESQRRFRERQKARAQEAEAKLSKATNELLELRNRQAELEARNQLLENTARVNRPIEAEVSFGVTVTVTVAQRSVYTIFRQLQYLCMKCCQALTDSETISWYILLLQSLQQAEAERQTAPSRDPSPEAGMQDPSAVLILVSQEPYCLTAEEASKLSIPAFSILWTVSLHPPSHHK